MSNKELNSVEQDSTPTNSSLNQNASRRGFFKKAVIGSAVVTTITSRPALAGICNLSGNLSNNVSNHEHINTECHYNTYSPGGLDNGPHAAIWNYAYSGVTLLTKNSPLSDLFSSTAITGTIIQAINGDLPSLPSNQKGFVKQLTAAAINSLIWQYAMDTCVDPSCSILTDISSDFYWPVEFAEIEDIFDAGKDGLDANKYDWDAIQKID
ncbi:MAG: hypothetical protein ACSHW0_15725 [Thalassotalea sp.]